MTESAYLKHTVGPVLAKAVAETVVAQPSNPQEYLALYLLHVLQEEERAKAAAARKQKAETQRQIWAKEREHKEKRAAATIQRFFRQCRAAIQNRRKEETKLWEKYEEAEAEAEELMDTIEPPEGRGGLINNNNDNDNMNREEKQRKTGGDAESQQQQDEEEEAENAREEAISTLEESRSEFYKAQRFMLYIRKAFIGTLKTELIDRREQVRVAQDRLHDILDAAAAEMQEEEEREEYIKVTAGTIPGSTLTTTTTAAAAEPLATKVAAPRHEKISVAMLIYRVLRCFCYLFFNSTPKETDTPAKVAALVKPFTFMQLLRAFNPVGTYQRNRPFRLEQLNSGSSNEDESRNDGDDINMQEGGSEPISQPKPRQVRRVSRVLRVLMHDMEYISSVNPMDYFDEDDDDFDNTTTVMNEADGASTSSHNNNNNNNNNNNISQYKTQYSNDTNRAAEIISRVEATARQHGVMLHSLLRLLRTAVSYREARDHWLQLLQQSNNDIPQSVEIPEDDEGDANNDEGLRDDDGEVDVEAVRRLLLIIGTDTDEELSKIWAAKDAAWRVKLKALAAARRKEREDEEEEDEDGNGGHDDDDDESTDAEE